MFSQDMLLDRHILLILEQNSCHKSNPTPKHTSTHYLRLKSKRSDR